MHNRPFVIVVGVDFEPDGELAFDQAVRIAANIGNAEIHVLNVDKSMSTMAPSEEVDGRDPKHESALDKLETFAQQHMETVLGQMQGRTFQRVVTHVRRGRPAHAIVQLAVDLDADLIVLGTHNRKGIQRLVLGSVAETVVHQARCPVQVVRVKDHLDVGEVPEIEPPCEACLQTRAESNGAEMWCARHALARYRPRVHRVMRGAAGREPEPWSQSTPEV